VSKIAVITDSNSGITQKQGEELGIFILPMPFMINGESFFEDINLTAERFYKEMAGGANIMTSQPSPESVISLWDKLLQDHDEIVHIPMSSGLSSSCESAAALALDYDGRVQVVNNQRISVTQRQSAFDAKALADKGFSAAEIKQKLEDDKFNSSIYIMLDTLYYLKKGGRITPAAAALGTILRLKPVLQIQGEKLDAFAKARTTAQGRSIMVNAIKSDMQTRFGSSGDGSGCILCMAHTENREAAELWREEVLKVFPACGDIYIDRLPLSIATHIGPGSLAITCTKKMDY